MTGPVLSELCAVEAQRGRRKQREGPEPLSGSLDSETTTEKGKKKKTEKKSTFFFFNFAGQKPTGLEQKHHRGPKRRRGDTPCRSSPGGFAERGGSGSASRADPGDPRGAVGSGPVGSSFGVCEQRRPPAEQQHLAAAASRAGLGAERASARYRSALRSHPGHAASPCCGIFAAQDPRRTSSPRPGILFPAVPQPCSAGTRCAGILSMHHLGIQAVHHPSVWVPKPCTAPVPQTCIFPSWASQILALLAMLHPCTPGTHLHPSHTSFPHHGIPHHTTPPRPPQHPMLSAHHPATWAPHPHPIPTQQPFAGIPTLSPKHCPLPIPGLSPLPASAYISWPQLMSRRH